MSLRRVLFLVDSMKVGGSELAAYRTAKAICNSVNLTVVHLQQDGPLLERYRLLPIELRHMRIHGMTDPRAAMGMFKLRSAVTLGRYDIVHSHDYYSNILAFVALAGKRMPKRIAARRWLFQYVRPIHRRLDALAQRSADIAIVNSGAVADVCIQEGVQRERVRILRNFISEEQISMPRPLASSQRDSEIRIGVVGRLAAVKNHKLAIDSFAKIARLLPQLTLHICGDGELRAYLEDYARDSGLGQRVIFRGNVREGVEVFREFHIALLTSTSEGSPNAILEAMAAGSAVVATRVGGVGEMVRQHETGILADSGDSDAIASAIEFLATDAFARERIVRNAYDFVIQEARESLFVSRLLGLYEELLAR